MTINSLAINLKYPAITDIITTAINKPNIPGDYIFTVVPSDGLPSGVALNDIATFEDNTWFLSKTYKDAPPTISVGLITQLQYCKDGNGSWKNLNIISNDNVASDANIETSKIRQSVITPVLATPVNNDTQDVINNKSLGLINNLQSQIDTRPIGASNGNVYYLTSQASAIPNYELVSFSPDPSPLDVESVVINSTTLKQNRLIHSYIANYEIGSAIVNGGNWLFNFYGYASNLDNSRFEIDIIKRDIGGTETLLFTCETTNLLETSQISPDLNIANVETTQQDFVCNTTDKIVIKVYGKTNRTQDTTITLLHSGTEYASHIHTPLIVSHNNLAGTQGGTATEKYHLSLADYNKLAGIQAGAEVNVQANWSETNNTADSFIQNKPTLGTVASKNLGTAVGNIQENGATLVASQTVETDSSGKIITVAKNDAYNQTFGTGTNNVARGDASYLKADTYNKTEINTFNAGKNVKTWYVSGGINGSGIDTNNGYSPNNAFNTLSKLNTVLGSTGEQVVLLPSELTESVTFTQQNLEVTGQHASHRGVCGTTGTITSNHSASSQTYSYFSCGSFVKQNAYTKLYDLKITNSFSDSGSGVLDAYNLTFNATTPISITGSGIKNFYNQRGGIFAINNASASVNVVSSDYISQFTLTAGTLSIRNAIVYVADGTTFTLGSAGATIFCENVRFLYANNTPAKINAPSGLNYSLQSNCVFDRANSTLNGTDISGIYQGYYSDIASKSINLTSGTASTLLGLDANKKIASLPTSTYPSLTELTNVKGTTSPIQTQLNNKLETSLKGANNGLAELDSTGKVPSNQLPAYVDDVIEVANFVSLPPIGETGKIYIAIDTNRQYRWSGTQYVEISSSLALGETSSTAYRGDRGKIAFDHSQSTGNPHGTTKTDIGLGNVDNTSDVNKPISSATQTALNTKEPTITPGTISQFYRGDKTFQTLDKNAVGLGNVDNTADINKNVLSATKLTTSININGVAFDGTSNITITDTTKQPLDATLTALSDLDATAGIFVQTSADTFTKRTLTAGTGISITNGDGVAGNPSFQIADGGVTNAKLAQVATNTVKGRITAGTGNVEDIQIDTTLKTALNLNNVTNDAQLKIASNLSDVNSQQTALNNITNVASATNEYVLTKDTVTGNALFKPASGGGGGGSKASATFGKLAGNYSTYIADSGYTGERILWDTTISRNAPLNEITLNLSTGVINLVAGEYLILAKTNPLYSSTIYNFGIRVILGGSEYVQGTHTPQSQVVAGTAQRMSETIHLAKTFTSSGKVVVEHIGGWVSPGYTSGLYTSTVTIIKIN